MSNDWFRSWHGAPTDNKWLVIGRRAGVAPGIVSAVVWALFDFASQNENRGSVAAFDIETYSAFSGFDEAQVSAVIEALKEKGVIGPDGGLSSWNKRQPKREDNNSTDRSRAFRAKHNENERNATQCNAAGREATLDKTREDTDTERKKERGAPAGASHTNQPVGHVWPADAFDRWYAEYPHKVGKGSAQAAFDKIRRSGKVPFESLMTGLANYRKTKLPHVDWCNPATWLNAERWSDSPAEATGQSDYERQRAAMKRPGWL